MKSGEADQGSKWLQPIRVLQLSLAVGVSTVLLKTLAWWLTDSVGFLSDALESLVNVAGAGFALAMVNYARKPADDDHRFGHGKAEYFSAAFEGALILVAAIAIIVAAAGRLSDPKPLEALGMGTALSLIAAALNGGMSVMLIRAGRLHRSLALEADGRHLRTDVWTTFGVIAGVLAAMATGWLWLDPVIAILVALNIVREGTHLIQRSAGGLMDRALDGEQVAEIEQTLKRMLGPECSYRHLRTRESGMHHFADVKLLVPQQWSVKRAHDLADSIEKAVREQGVKMLTHIEPLMEVPPVAPPVAPGPVSAAARPGPP